MKLNPHFLHPFFLRLSPPLHSQLLPSPQQHKGVGLWSVPNSLSALVFVLVFSPAPVLALHGPQLPSGLSHLLHCGFPMGCRGIPAQSASFFISSSALGVHIAFSHTFFPSSLTARQDFLLFLKYTVAEVPLVSLRDSGALRGGCHRTFWKWLEVAEACLRQRRSHLTERPLQPLDMGTLYSDKEIQSLKCNF